MKSKNQDPQQQLKVDSYEFEPIKGYPMLNWKGKRPFTSTQYYPAQLKESYGKPGPDGWMNKIFWGDNLQVMSHLLKDFRSKIDLVYIDPPFDSNADYKRNIQIRGAGKKVSGDYSTFEEKQYTDIWNNDDYLQFIYDRVILIKELLSDSGSLFLHCDERKSHHIRCLLEEVFGPERIISQIFWKRRTGMVNQTSKFGNCIDTIIWVAKSEHYTYNRQYTKHDSEDYIKEKFNNKDPDGRLYRLSGLTNPSYRPTLKYSYKGRQPPPNGWSVALPRMEELDKLGLIHFPQDKSKRPMRKDYLDLWPGYQVQNLWLDIVQINPMSKERLDYPTQKPESLIERIVKATSKPGDLVFDCFMGSGTTQAVAMKLGRKFVGADINLGAIATSTKRLNSIIVDGINEFEEKNPVGEDDQLASIKVSSFYENFEVYNVNNYDIFRNPAEARDILMKALEIQPIKNNAYDGEKDGRMVKIMPVNRIASKSDLGDLTSGFDYKTFDKRQKENPNKPVEKILLVCMGHEPDLKAHLEKEVDYKLDIEIVDILRDKQDLQFKRDSEVLIKIKKDKLVIEKFYPMNLLQKLSMQKDRVTDWRELVEAILIDWNYDGAILTPRIIDIPEKDDFVKGEYEVPKDIGTIRVKITDLLSESIEVEVTRA